MSYLGNIGRKVVSGFKTATGTGKGGPGMLGVGQYTANPNAIDQTPFTQQNATEQASQQEFANQLAQQQNYNAPKMAQTNLGNAAQMQAANINTGNTSQDRSQQMALARQLQQQMAGQGPNLAQAQLQQATDQNLKQSMAMAASAQGQQQGGLALRNAQNQQANIGQQAAQQAEQTRAQQELSAQQQYGQLAGQMSNEDLSQAQAQAQLQQQAAGANQSAQNQFAVQQANMNQNVGQQNLQSQLTTQQQKNQTDLGLLSGQTGLGENQQSNAMSYQNLAAQQNLGAMGLDEKGFAAASQARGNMVANTGKGLAAGAKMFGIGGGAHGGYVSGRDAMEVRVSPGEIVIPGDIARGGAEDMDEFVNALQASSKDDDDDEDGYARGGVVRAPVVRAPVRMPKAKTIPGNTSHVDTSEAEVPEEEKKDDDDEEEGGFEQALANEQEEPQMATGGFVLQPLSVPDLGHSGDLQFNKSSEDTDSEPAATPHDKSDLYNFAYGGKVLKMDKGGKVPGTPEVAGDSPSNDTVHAMLKPGSVVMPRTAVQDPMARQQFYQALMANQQIPQDHEDDLAQAFKSRKRA